MRTFAAFAILAAIALLSGCATPRAADANYTAYVQFVQQQAEADQRRFESIAATAQQCTTDACVQQVAALAALAQAGGGRSSASIAPYQRQFHPAWGILGAAVPALINGAVSWRQTEVNRDVSIAQYEWLGGMMRDLSQSPALHAPEAPAITVGGDYVTGQQHIGDTIGRDVIGRDQHIGDDIGRDAIAGDQHVGDDIGRDVIDNTGNIGSDNRIDSPGPYDNDQGDSCEGTACQGENNPPPDPDEG